jgi:hypothetical protein
MTNAQRWMRARSSALSIWDIVQGQAGVVPHSRFLSAVYKLGAACHGNREDHAGSFYKPVTLLQPFHLV